MITTLFSDPATYGTRDRANLDEVCDLLEGDRALWHGATLRSALEGANPHGELSPSHLLHDVLLPIEKLQGLFPAPVLAYAIEQATGMGAFCANEAGRWPRVANLTASICERQAKRMNLAPASAEVISAGGADSFAVAYIERHLALANDPSGALMARGNCLSTLISEAGKLGTSRNALLARVADPAVRDFACHLQDH